MDDYLYFLRFFLVFYKKLLKNNNKKVGEKLWKSFVQLEQILVNIYKCFWGA